MTQHPFSTPVQTLNQTAMDQARSRWDSLAKPVGSLGVLEALVVQLAGMTGTAQVALDQRAVLVLCADNGVLAQGVAQTPGHITAVMARFMAQKRSAVCLMAQVARAQTFIVDMGLSTALDMPGLLDRHVARGTADMTCGPAMTKEQARQAIQTGMDLVRDCKDQGFQILATGEMGIGNTTTSSAVAAALLDQPVETLTGRGAGLSDQGLQRKISAIQRAIQINQPDGSDALDVLHKLGGFDLAGLCGVFLGGARYGLPIIVDGLISAVAALVAARLCPAATSFMIASHQSAEPASQVVLSALGLTPIIHAKMRLGEGTGAVALLPLLDQALAVYHNLMTFDDIGL